MGEGKTGGASDKMKAKSSGEDPRATGGLVSNLPHPRVNKTKQHTSCPPSVIVPAVGPTRRASCVDLINKTKKGSN